MKVGSASLSTIDLLKSRAKKLTEFADLGRPFFSDDFEFEPEAIEKFLSFEEPAQRSTLVCAIQELSEAYQALGEFSLETTEKLLREVGERHDIKAGKFIGAIRVALTGKTAAPGIFDVIVTLGKERTLQRLRQILTILQ